MMNLGTALIIVAFCVGIALLIASMAMMQYEPTGCIIAIIISFALFGWALLGNHFTDCQCKICYEMIGQENGIDVYKDKNNNLYYWHKINQQHIAIIQEDGSNYTYDEFLEKQLKEYNNKIPKF